VAKTLAKAQNRSLRVVAGAYKATPIRCLETETWVPPLDLYLNKRLADFEIRQESKVLEAGQGPGTPKKAASSLVTEACYRIYRRFRKRRRGRGPVQRPRPQGPTDTERAAAEVAAWVCREKGDQGEVDTGQAVEREWRARWERQWEGRPRRRIADKDPPNLLFTEKTLKKHEGLTKAQSSLLT